MCNKDPILEWKKSFELYKSRVFAEKAKGDASYIDPGKHYRYEYKGVKLDPARIAKVYGMIDHMEFFILKKVLRMGSAHKDKRQELRDIINAAERRLEMIDEDGE